MNMTIDQGNNTMDRINACIANRKPALLALPLVDVLKDSGWSPDDVHFLGSEIINESGMLWQDIKTPHAQTPCSHYRISWDRQDNAAAYARHRRGPPR